MFITREIHINPVSHFSIAPVSLLLIYELKCIKTEVQIIPQAAVNESIISYPTLSSHSSPSMSTTSTSSAMFAADVSEREREREREEYVCHSATHWQEDTTAACFIEF